LAQDESLSGSWPFWVPSASPLRNFGATSVQDKESGPSGGGSGAVDTIDIILADGSRRKVPYGTISLPNMGEEAHIEIFYSDNDKYLRVRGECQFKFQSLMDEIIEKTNFLLKTDSILHLAFEISTNKNIGELLALNPIYFDFDKSNIRPDAAIELDKVVEFLKKYPEVKIELGSHTDSRGPASYNQSLSEKRAISSAKYLKKRVENPKRISYKGYGESKTTNGCNDKVNCTEEQHQMNRRTEFIIQK
jgi:outer membrane protein OmpA-like peptidoglycan-associated protein